MVPGPSTQSIMQTYDSTSTFKILRYQYAGISDGTNQTNLRITYQEFGGVGTNLTYEQINLQTYGSATDAQIISISQTYAINNDLLMIEGVLEDNTSQKIISALMNQFNFYKKGIFISAYCLYMGSRILALGYTNNSIIQLVTIPSSGVAENNNVQTFYNTSQFWETTNKRVTYPVYTTTPNQYYLINGIQQLGAVNSPSYTGHINNSNSTSMIAYKDILNNSRVAYFASYIYSIYSGQQNFSRYCMGLFLWLARKEIVSPTLTIMQNSTFNILRYVYVTGINDSFNQANLRPTYANLGGLSTNLIYSQMDVTTYPYSTETALTAVCTTLASQYDVLVIAGAAQDNLSQIWINNLLFQFNLAKKGILYEKDCFLVTGNARINNVGYNNTYNNTTTVQIVPVPTVPVNIQVQSTTYSLSNTNLFWETTNTSITSYPISFTGVFNIQGGMQTVGSVNSPSYTGSNSGSTSNSFVAYKQVVNGSRVAGLSFDFNTIYTNGATNQQINNYIMGLMLYLGQKESGSTSVDVEGLDPNEQINMIFKLK